MMYWRFIITAIASAVIMILQGVQISIDILTEYILKDTKPSNWSYSFLTPDLFHIDREGKRTVSYVNRFLILNVTYFGSLFVFLLLCNSIFWKRRPSRWFLLISMGIVVIGVATAPFNIKKGWFMYLDRSFQGGGSALVYPLVFDHLVLWVPPKERGLACSLVYGGMPLSVALTIWFTDVICRVLKWDQIFYIGLSFVVLIELSLYFMSPVPKLHRFISVQEENYIRDQFETAADVNEKRRRLKLKTLFSWKPFLAILYANFCLFWGWNIILFVLPLYLEHIHGIKVLESITLTALPFVLSWLVGITFGILQDILVKHEILSATVARRMCVLISSVLPLMCFLMLNFAGTIFAIHLIGIIISAWGAGLSAIFSNFMDIAPNFGGILMIFAAFAMTLSFFFVFIVFYLTLNFTLLSSYWVIFSLTSGIYASEAGVSFYISASEAYWNIPDEE